jgi:hypothetical protein
LANVAEPHAGHSVSGASDTFCSTSLSFPQDEHLYAYIGMAASQNPVTA